MQMITLAAAALAAAFLLRVDGAAAETRSLKLRHVHSGAEAVIAYKRDGRYLPEGLKRIDALFADWRTKRSVKMDPHLLDLLWEVHARSGAKGPVAVIGGYRSPATNKMLRSRSKGVAKVSQHTRGKAIDFFIPGVPLRKIREIALTLQGGGVGYYPRSGSPFVHLDVGKARYWPRMPRRQLMALFPRGDSVYLPSDGKPLPGYRQALATQAAHRRAGTLPGGGAEKAPGATRTLISVLTGGGAKAARTAPRVRAAALVQPMRPVPAVRTGDSQPAPGASQLDGPRRVPTPLWRADLTAAGPDEALPVPAGAPRPAMPTEIASVSSAQSGEDGRDAPAPDGIGRLMASLSTPVPVAASGAHPAAPVPLPRPPVAPRAIIARAMLAPPDSVLMSRFEPQAQAEPAPGFTGRAVHFSPIAWTARQEDPAQRSAELPAGPQTGSSSAAD